MRDLLKRIWFAVSVAACLGNQAAYSNTDPSSEPFPNNQFSEAQTDVGNDGNIRVLWNTFTSPGAGGYTGSILWILDKNGNFLSSGTPAVPGSVGFGQVSGVRPNILVKGQASGNTTLAFLFPGAASFGVWAYNSAGNLVSAVSYGPFAGTTIQDLRFAANGKIIVVWAPSTPPGPNEAWTLNEFGGIETVAGPFGPFANTFLSEVDLGENNQQRWLWNSPRVNGNPGASPELLTIWTFNVAGQVTATAVYGPY
jgi:hypothetical protein